MLNALSLRCFFVPSAFYHNTAHRRCIFDRIKYDNIGILSTRS